MTEVQAASHSCITFAMKKTHFSSLSSAHLCKPAMLGFVFHDICRPQPQVLEDFRGCAPHLGEGRHTRFRAVDPVTLSAAHAFTSRDAFVRN